MKTIYTLFLMCLVAMQLCAQQTANPKLSANLRQFLHSSASTQSNNQSIVYTKTNGIVYISTIIKVNKTISVSGLNKLGVLIGTKAGNIWTAKVPENQIRNFANFRGIDYIQLDEPINANLDVARKSSRVDSVQDGTGLPMGYSGKGVVVGIIDAGFDYTHPTFYDTTGNVLRLKRVWEQHNEGTPPAGYSYGNELTDTAAMLVKGYEVNSFSHGTHVGGIAAGSGYGSLNNKKMRGMAYESDLVFVGIRPEKSEWKSMGMSSILDGINYIFKYAQSVGKPAVVNLSWGNSIGPNDGSSLFSQACNNLTGPGRIFVLSAGNNGDENIHLQKQFTGTDTLVHTFVSFPDIDGEKLSWIDLWGEPAESFCVKLSLYNGNTTTDSTTFMCLASNTIDTFLIGSNNDTCFFTLTASAADLNGKPHILIDVTSRTTNILCISIAANKGTVNMWQGYVKNYSGYYGAFTNNGKAWAVNGDNHYTLGEMACTESAITVAAYASKISFKNLQGSTISYSGYASFNQIVPFSSHGPTIDGRIKPDIAAPGMTLASAVNSFDVSYAAGGGNYGQSVAKYTFPKNSRDYFYAEASGTSMSSPVVSGIVAIMLQVNPALSPQRIKEIIFQTATKDNFTTQHPDSARWGAGKINAYAAIKRAILTVGLTEQIKQNQTVKVFPNPATGMFSVSMEAHQQTTAYIEITNMMGQVINALPWDIVSGTNSLLIDSHDMTQGVYFVNVIQNGQQLIQKVVIY